MLQLGCGRRKFSTACVDAGFLSFVNKPSSHYATPFQSSAASRSRWLPSVCREKSFVISWSNPTEHNQCLSEILQVACWPKKCGRFNVVHCQAARMGVELVQTPDAESAREACAQRMSNLSYDRRGVVAPQQFAMSYVGRERAPRSVCTVSGNHLRLMMQVQGSMSYCGRLESSSVQRRDGGDECLGEEQVSRLNA